MIYNATLEYSARSKSIDILPNSYIAMALYCNLYGILTMVPAKAARVGAAGDGGIIKSVSVHAGHMLRR